MDSYSLWIAMLQPLSIELGEALQSNLLALGIAITDEQF